MQTNAVIRFNLLLTFLTVSGLAAAPKKNLNKFTPSGLVAKALPVDDNHPAGSNELTFKIVDLPRGIESSPWAVEIEKKIGDRVRVSACDSTFSAIASSPWSRVVRVGGK